MGEMLLQLIETSLKLGPVLCCGMLGSTCGVGSSAARGVGLLPPANATLARKQRRSSRS